MVTGRPSMASSVALMSFLTKGNSSSTTALRFEDLFLGGLAGLLGLGRLGLLLRDHLPQQEQRLVGALAVEHVLGAEQADALGAEAAGHLGVVGRVGVGPHAQRAVLVDDLHELLEAGVFRGVDHLQGPGVGQAPGAVERDHVAFLERRRAGGQGLGGHVDLQAPAPTMQHLPQPRATSAAWLVMPPRAVRMPSAARIPSTSSGLVSSRTRITFLPALAAGPRPRPR